MEMFSNDKEKSALYMIVNASVVCNMNIEIYNIVAWHEGTALR